MILYALTILFSAFLLFQVQPVIAKIILPWFGGSAAVWTTCMLFFQLVLLLGYLYAHWLTRSLRPKAQSVVHAAVLAVSLLALPVIPGAAWKPSGTEDPTLRILGLLAATVGLPYFLLSTTGPLIQAWYARRFAGSMPYRLYALSNAGSMFALLSYPMAVEPVFGTHRQANLWSIGYALFVVCCGATAFAVSRYAALKAPLASGDDPPPGLRLHLLWIGLPACASLLLLAITNHLTQNVAAIPFLWVVPLSLYLLSFILCFEGEGWYRRNPYLQLLAVALGGMAYALSNEFENTGVKVLVPLFASALFICCMVCHGELVKLKPHPRYLTQFYLMVSLGGALGGVFVALLAPHIFTGYYEMHVGVALCGILVLYVLYERTPNWFISAALGLGLVAYVGFVLKQSRSDAKLRLRDFYGALKVSDTGGPEQFGSVRKLTHGTINHGEQFLDPDRRRLPTTYYGPNTGVGLAIRSSQQFGPIRVGVIGLGTGTLASYGRPGDYYRFYEINPAVLRLARTQFTFLGDCRAKLDVALGDARLSLERERDDNFDVLAVDAFSSDSIPVHLLTREAFELYFRQLKPTGILAVHISNKYLNLQPVVAGIADSLGKQARLVDTEDEEETDVFGATWALVTARREVFADVLLSNAATNLERKVKVRLWTDDYSNLFKILK